MLFSLVAHGRTEPALCEPRASWPPGRSGSGRRTDVDATGRPGPELADERDLPCHAYDNDHPPNEREAIRLGLDPSLTPLPTLPTLPAAA